ncbi:MAG: carbohydrate kinase [SAR324 cluster bacterium]|nr:carbohydrate kinase [SAR324 cluster bacterium]
MKTSELSEIEILCHGATAYDITMSVKHHPAADIKEFALDKVECGGGPAANAAVTIARMGHKTALSGYLGNDLYGQLNLEELAKDHVNTDLIQRGDASTPLSVVMAKPNGERSLVNYPSQSPFMTRLSPQYKSCSPQVILLDGHETNTAFKLLEFAKKQNITTVLDAGSYSAGKKALASEVDHLVVTERFAHEYTSQKKTEAALETLFEISNSVVITVGKEGLLWKNKNNSGKMPAFSVQSIDTTGAGDAFHGAFCVGLIRGYDWETILRYASAVAALTCTKHGGRLGIPREHEVQNFLKKKWSTDW